ncbi:MAG: bifunctional DNA-formamidopyrimidine glycosylase/DNA-(apurinic or apyrimidinic site) lyase [Chloroflexi bacterium]|nr:bifunctional DNA-formamidopyrimidine glycosylase/DNA-(apurinic or apyrimidinic site) lyase [Chloroflexota bacterium]
MPELPEVETIRRELEPYILGRRIQTVRVLRPDIITKPGPRIFRRRLAGKEIQGLGRRGKFLVISLSGGDLLLAHLGMSGALYLKRSEDPLLKHTHLRLALDNAYEVRYVDPRRFGQVLLVSSLEEAVAELGPEPLADDFSAQHLATLLSRRKGRLKPLLLNQRFLAGLGNIYSDESLFLARLHPRRRAATLKPKDKTRLHQAIRQALGEGIQHLGSSIDGSYRRPDESQGEHQNHFRVYGREGEPCFRCRTPIVRIVMGGRSTYFCPHCQK